MFFLSFSTFCADINQLRDRCDEYKLCSKHNVKKTYTIYLAMRFISVGFSYLC